MKPLFSTNVFFWLPLAVLAGFSSSVAAATVKVETQSLESLYVYPQYEFSAEIRPHTVSVISSELNAKLQQVLIRPGVSVDKGQLLAKLDCADTKARLDQVEAAQMEVSASLQLTELQAARLQNLESRQLVSTNQLDEIRTQKKALLAKKQGLEVDQKNSVRAIKRCQIHAPFAAVVTDIRAGEGQWLAMGVPLFELYRQDRAEIEVLIPYALAKQYHSRASQWQGDTFEAVSVDWLRQSAVVDARQRMAKVWFKAPPAQPLGSAGTLLFIEQKPHLPVSTVVKRHGVYGVFIVENSQAVFKAIPSAEDGRPAAVPAAWQSDWLVVTQGQQRLQNGDRVK